jgi:chondroitin AC lyase
MKSELTPLEKENAITVLQISGFRMTGQNKVWLAGNVLLKALLANNEPLARSARDTIASEIYKTEKEGIQPDFSFHQHGPQQQFGNYGLSFISSMSYYANVFGGTGIGFSSAQISILRDYVFDGENWIVWHGYMDVNACNRQLFKQAQSGKALALCVATDQLKKADLANEKDYNNLIQRNLHPGSLAEKPQSKHFWRSDLTVNRSANHYISVRACSPRLIGTEFTNNENKKGHFIADGTTIVMRRGDEFKDIFPIWDWNRLPGVTAPILDSIIPRTKTDNYRNPNSFVGGLAHHTNSISTFHLDRNKVNAKKSWFYLSGILVCLGVDIESNSGSEIVTGVNQVLQRSKVTLTTKQGQSIQPNDTLAQFNNLHAVWHDSIGYIFPKNDSLSIYIGSQSGDWHSIADPYSSGKLSGRVFKLWLEHGVNASSSSAYEYIVLPSISLKKLADFSQNTPIEIVANRSDIQGVRFKDGSVFQYVFHNPCRINTFSTHDYVEAKNPGLLMIEKDKTDHLYLTVADPTQTLKRFRLIISGRYSGKQAIYNLQNNETTLTILLPQGGKAGSSVSFGLSPRIK